MILLQLRCKDILLAQRVSKKWQAAIAGSNAIQKALYLLPTQSPGTDLPCGLYTIPFHLLNFQEAEIDDNLTLENVQPHVGDWYEPNIAIASSAQHLYAELTVPKRTMIINPLAEWLFVVVNDCDTFRFDVFFETERDLENQETSSWYNMYLTQPPAIEVSVYPKSMRYPSIRVPSSDGGRERWVYVLDIDSTIRSEAGLTIGQLFEKVDKMMEDRSDMNYLLGGFRIMAR